MHLNYMKLLACVDIRSSIDLIIYKTYADLRQERERTYLGMVWWFLEPIINIAIYYFVFDVIMSRGTEDFVVFLAVGVIVWRWFAGTVQQGSNAILGNVRLLRRVALAQVAFPLITVLTNTIQFIFSLSVLFVVLRLYGYTVNIYWLAFPALMFVQFLLILGVTLPLSAIVPFFPDLAKLTTHAIRILFYLSGIFWAIPDTSPKLQQIMLLNPMALLIQSFRNVLMYQQWPPVLPLLIVSLVSLIGIYFGAFLISRFNQSYAKRITH